MRRRTQEEIKPSDYVKEKMLALSEVSHDGMAAANSFLDEILNGTKTFTSDDLKYIQTFIINLPYASNEYLPRILQAVTAKLEASDPAISPSQVEPIPQASSEIAAVLIDCENLLQEIENVVMLNAIPAIKLELDTKIEALATRQDLTSEQRLKVKSLQACSEFWKLIHEISDFRVRPHEKGLNGQKKYEEDAGIAPLTKLVELIRTDAFVEEYLNQLKQHRKKAFEKITGIASKIHEFGLENAPLLQRWENVSSEGRATLRQLGQALSESLQPPKTSSKTASSSNPNVDAKLKQIQTSDHNAKLALFGEIYPEIYELKGKDYQVKSGMEIYAQSYEDAWSVYEKGAKALASQAQVSSPRTSTDSPGGSPAGLSDASTFSAKATSPPSQELKRSTAEGLPQKEIVLLLEKFKKAAMHDEKGKLLNEMFPKIYELKGKDYQVKSGMKIYAQSYEEAHKAYQQEARAPNPDSLDSNQSSNQSDKKWVQQPNTAAPVHKKKKRRNNGADSPSPPIITILKIDLLALVSQHMKKEPKNLEIQALFNFISSTDTKDNLTTDDLENFIKKNPNGELGANIFKLIRDPVGKFLGDKSPFASMVREIGFQFQAQEPSQSYNAVKKAYEQRVLQYEMCTKTIDEYKSKASFTKSTDSKVLAETLDTYKNEIDFTIAITQIQAKLKKSGKSTLVSMLFKNGLAEIRPDLFINRMTVAVNQYLAMEKAKTPFLGVIPSPRSYNHANICNAIITVLNKPNITPAEKLSNITEILKKDGIGDGRLYNLFKENGLEKFAEKCAEMKKPDQAVKLGLN